MSSGVKAFYVHPIEKGNPVFSMDIDKKHGFIVIGYASGGIDCTVLPRYIGGIKRNIDDEKRQEISLTTKGIKYKEQELKSKYNTFVIRRLLKKDYECCRYVYIRKNYRIISCVGDYFLREWTSYSSTKSQLIRYLSTKHKETCNEAQFISYKNYVIISPKYKSRQLIYYNLDTMKEVFVMIYFMHLIYCFDGCIYVYVL